MPSPESPSADNARSIAGLPDAPAPQEQTQAPPQSPLSGTHINQFPRLAPGLTRTPLTAQDKLHIYIHKTFGPPAVILPAFGVGIGMAGGGKSNYPKEWKDGAGAFGRLYGDKVATRTSRDTADFLTDVLLHEDPRYPRAASTNAFGRTLHALTFTVLTKTDSGRDTIAVNHLAAAAAGGFVGMGYLPDGYNDATHAEQRMASEFAAIAVGNIVTEFEPEWGPWAKKLRIPKILPPWWVPQHPHP
jgi:hypothetical protein